MAEYGSLKDLAEERLFRQMDFDNQQLVAWVEDTLTPSFDLMKLKISIREIIQDIVNHASKKGETHQTKASLEKFEKMLDICERLDKVAMQNNTFQLIVKHTDIQLANAQARIFKLEAELSAIKTAWEQE